MASPTWNDKVAVVTVQKVASGSSVRGTLNLTGLFGAYIFGRVGRLTTAAPSSGAYILVRRLLYDSGGARDIPHPSPLAEFQDVTTAAVAPTISSLSAGPPGSFTVSSATGLTGNLRVCLVDSTSSPTRAEWHRTAKIASTTLTLDRAYANISSGDTLTTQALLLPPIWVDGTPTSTDIEVVFDNSLDTNSSHIVVEAWAQTLSAVS